MMALVIELVWVLFLIMFIGILLIIGGISTVNIPAIVVGILLLLAGDAICMGISSDYMHSPTGAIMRSGDRCFVDGVGWSDCVYPSVNPYEQQPLHPIKWTWDLIVGGCRFLHDNQPIIIKP